MCGGADHVIKINTVLKIKQEVTGYIFAYSKLKSVAAFRETAAFLIDGFLTLKFSLKRGSKQPASA